jgi:hypothetical protein
MGRAGVASTTAVTAAWWRPAVTVCTLVASATTRWKIIS